MSDSKPYTPEELRSRTDTVRHDGSDSFETVTTSRFRTTVEALESERAANSRMRGLLAQMVEVFETQDDPDDDRWDVLFEQAVILLRGKP